MKIYTKTGDSGITSLLGGTKVDKHDLRIEAYGTVDELNSAMGILRDHDKEAQRADLYIEIQEQLFTIGSHLALEPGNASFNLPEIPNDAVGKLEQAIDLMDNDLPEMKNFVLPGGHPNVSYAHLARTICRRAERRVTALAKNDENFNNLIIIYLNRLSDYLFMLSRKISQELNIKETPWKPRG